ncbi:MAG: TetR/AcrR family transcriptional regulator [Planctomycetaceae bacterium]
MQISPTTTDARTQKKNDRRRAIVEAAARLFAEHGFADCDMECVAGSLGIAKGTLYLYFPGKVELFRACVDWGMAEMQRVVFEAAQGDLPPFLRLARSVRAYLEYFDQNPHYVELLIQERAMFRDRKRGTYFEYREGIRSDFRSIYAQLVADGILRSDLPLERLLDAVGSMLYGTMLFNNAIGRTISSDEQYFAVMSTVYGGLVTTEGQALLRETLEQV